MFSSDQNRCWLLLTTVVLISLLFSAVAFPETDISLWHSMHGAHKDALRNLISSYEDENPDIKVNLNDKGGYVELEESLHQAIDSNSPPVSSQALREWISLFVNTNAVEPLESYISRDLWDSLLPPLQESSQFMGKNYSVPFNKSSLVLFYNSDLIENPPTNWDELLTTARDLTVDEDDDGAPERYGFGIRPNPEIFSLFFHQAGGSFFNSDKSQFTVDSPAGEAAFNYLLNLREYSKISESYLSQPFGNGEVAMYIGSSAGIPYVDSSCEGNHDWSTAPLPEGPDNGQSLVQGTDLAIYRDGITDGQKAAAAGLFEYLAGDEQTIYWAKNTGYLPVTQSAIDSTKWTNYLSDNPVYKAPTEMIKNGFTYPHHRDWDSIRDLLSTAVTRVLVDGDDPVSVLNHLATKVEDKYLVSEIVVGTETEFPPFEFIRDGELVGFDIDLMERIATDQNFDMRWEEYSFESLIPTLRDGEVDCIIAGLTITKKREEVIDFSDPYLDYGIAVQEGNEKLLDKINAGLQNLKEGGDYMGLREKWLGDATFIGALVAKSGALASYGIPIQKSLWLAGRHVNNATDNLFQIISRDTETDPTVAVESAEDLVVNENVPAYVGALSSGNTLAVAESVSIPNGIVQVSPSATSPYLTGLSDKDLLFRTVSSDAAVGEKLANTINKNGHSTLSILYVNNPYGSFIADQIQGTFEEKGGEVVAKVGFPAGQKSYEEEVTEALSVNPDALALVGYLDDGIKILKKVFSKGYMGGLFLSGDLKKQEIIDAVGAENLEGAYVAKTEFIDETPSTEIFRNEYVDMYSTYPDKAFMEHSYDAAVLLGLAARKTKSSSSSPLKDNLRDVANPPGTKVYAGTNNLKEAVSLIDEGKEINYQGASGPITFDSNGNVSKPVRVWRVEDGEFVRVNPEGDKFKIGMAFSIGGRGDLSFNDSAYQGLQYALNGSSHIEGISALPVNVETATPSEGELEQAVRNFAENDFDLVIGVGFFCSSIMNGLADEYPDVNFAVIDYGGSEPKNNLEGITFNSYQGSFVVGAVAALKTETGKVGFIGGMSIPVVEEFEGGFKAGVNYIDSDVKVLTDYVGSFADPVKGKEIAIEQFDKGADVIFQAAGISGLGVLEAARDKDKFAIGVDVDQNFVEPGHVLTSMLKRVDLAVYYAIEDIVNGDFLGGTVVEYSLRDKGVGPAIDLFNRVEEHPEEVANLQETGTAWLPGLGKVEIPQEKINEMPEENLLTDEDVAEINQVVDYLITHPSYTIPYVVSHWDTENDKLNPDGDPTIATDEILTAIKWWAEDTTVPHTGGKTIDMATMLDLIRYWANNKKITASSGPSPTEGAVTDIGGS